MSGRSVLSLFSFLVAVPVFAGVYGDAPDATHAWAVHDRNRPNPVKITADPGRPPSDATVLFDGTEASFRANWCDVKGGASKWRFTGDAFESVKGAGRICTKAAFGDVQLHIEWASPAKVEGVGQGRGNSGVFLMGMYEIQVLDSYETDPAKDPNPNPNYADGQASAVYAENPPLVNASRAPGAWQTYDIVFHQPVWDGIRLVHPGSVTVFHNGVLTQDHWEMEGLTTHCTRRPLAPHAVKLPFELQDHGNPVRFRNVWLREIPSRYANVTHGGPAPDANAVMKLRRETAAKLFARIANPREVSIANMQALAEVISYAKEGAYAESWRAVAEGMHAQLDRADDAWLTDRKGDLLALRRMLDTLIKAGVVSQSCGTRKRISAIALRLGWDDGK